MELKPGLSAIVTGGAAGIGKSLCLALAQKGIFVTVIDLSEKGKEVAFLIDKEHTKLHPELKAPSALFVKCDVTNANDLDAAFEKHLEQYGGLDICINNAGIGNSILFHKDTTDGSDTWRRTINVNLTAVVDCTRIAIQIMRARKKPGVIINIGSASGLYPMYPDPIYSGTKGGVVLFTRSLAPLKREGIRVNVLCPEFVDTELGMKVDPRFVNASGGFISVEEVINGTLELITNESKAGACLWITKRRGMEYWPTVSEERKYLINSQKPQRRFQYTTSANIILPDTFEKIIVHTLDHNFRSATKVVRAQLKLPVKPKHAIVKIIYAGVNASDVNFSSGRYFGGKDEEILARLPFAAGFEAVGIIAAVGDSVQLKVGTPVALMTFGSYAEFSVVPAKHLLPVPRPDAEVVAMLTSGLTASIGLEKAGQMESGQVVLVTAAAGGTGQFAVQLAKLAGNKVVATCGGEKKASLLRSLGADRVIDYNKENIKDVLKTEFPKGVDIVYESVGGDMFNTCLNALAVYGRLIVIGMVSQYQGKHGWKPLAYPGLCEKLLAKSQAVAGFFLVQYAHLWQEHMDRLFDLYSAGKLKVTVDPKRFVGLSSVADAVEYLHSGKSLGKIVVCVDPAFANTKAKL
ncbi:zinc-binding alcohol dehydrogenase domain-containing protein 2 isoform X2 [Canna indica]|uniref:Zinc-binding alcohol dehydrogenase domain-containing protein 2 isoform X2 n=1 Tax=Canna indica TaxID=4628 RepID=A0AAQ3JRA5_9LILI|nr:zinc-binding alcohol dehydrogenase domain-containing protein 2 isoform X2 [Canna indica]